MGLMYVQKSAKYEMHQAMKNVTVWIHKKIEFRNGINVVRSHCIKVTIWLSLQYSQNTPHSSPVRASYGMYFVSTVKKINYVIMGPDCNNMLVLEI